MGLGLSEGGDGGRLAGRLAPIGTKSGPSHMKEGAMGDWPAGSAPNWDLRTNWRQGWSRGRAVGNGLPSPTLEGGGWEVPIGGQRPVGGAMGDWPPSPTPYWDGGVQSGAGRAVGLL